MENQNYNPSNPNSVKVPEPSTEEASGDMSNKKIITAFLLGIIIGFGSFWLWDKDKTDEMGDVEDGDKEEMVSDENGDHMEDTMGTSANSVSVKDQVAGDQVVISSVVMENAGWVAIQDDENGVPGRILGAQKFNAGEFSGVVELLRATVSGNTYHAVLRSDDGVEGFDPVLDLPIADSAGSTVLKTFTAL